MAHGSLDREHETPGRSQPCPGAPMAESPAAPRPPGPELPADGDGAAAPMETGAQLGTPPCLPPSHPPVEEDDFQFILCEGCRQESPNLKLLTCLHTLCLGCLSENKPIGQCPVCSTAIPQASGIPDMDNLLFINLQARLKVYKELSSSSGPSCSRCRVKTAAVWCSECEEFLCTKCFEDHQWFFKKKSHRAKRVEELRAESAHQFLEDNRKSCSLLCSTPGHAEQGHISSIYCQQCEKALCCSCALLDSRHTAFCDIRSETQRRQQELGTVTRALRHQRGGFEATCAALREEASRLERAQRELRELIRQRVEQLVRVLRREEEELLGMLEARQEQGRRELARELQRVEGVLRRMEAGERLVEKMGLYATEQEVMDMQPFIKGALQDLQHLQPPETRGRTDAGDLAECRARLQALVERVTGHPDTNSQADPVAELSLENNLQEEPVQPESESIMSTCTISLEEMQRSPADPVTTWPKRTSHCLEAESQTLPKLMKLEGNDTPGPSSPTSNQWKDERELRTSTPDQNCISIPATSSHVVDAALKLQHPPVPSAEDTSIVISSSEDSEEDTVASIKPEKIKNSSSPTWSRSGTSPHHSTGPNSPMDDESELSTLVFLSLKTEQRTQRIIEVAATSGEHTFKALIQTPESVLALLSQGVSMEVMIQNLLWYLSLFPRPVLVVYNFWAPKLPALFKALDAAGRKVDFCHAVRGYVDMLPLVKEKTPRASSYKFRNLLRKHKQQQRSEGSALTAAKALQELWGALELPACAEAGMLLTHCNLQSYTTLQALVQEKLLTRRAAKVLALRNLIFCELEDV
ncbi:protein PML-like isoform X1 [Neopsephotus bourkii]|uniref:protein PML-like isoform X1 n=1 Tax=Neopsephotus bourkii TaxID=309878 RepID=UPI002AA5BB02|nr:protein PML-like isoform X1 [Neopsephotus bourkii]